MIPSLNNPFISFQDGTIKLFLATLEPYLRKKAKGMVSIKAIIEYNNRLNQTGIVVLSHDKRK